MDPERWQEIERLCYSALHEEGSARAAFLQQACGGDEALRRAVEMLLAQHAKDDDFLEVPAMEVAAKDLARDRQAAASSAPTAAADWLSGDETQGLPSSIGNYRVVRLLGAGGMGAVYEAEQENPHRTVALKVIRAGYADPEMQRRFENEAQALGRLQHSGIAQIYEAGTAETPFGKQPYFAMELVRGKTLLAYCNEHHLNTRQRLELMAKICDAVQHAHQRGLIHRDLKPANILVDESGQPKILDFGVARLTDSDAQATRQTNIGEILGTLAYMSPEQVQGDPLALDTRSDVYALGVVLYELLAGRMPYTLSRQIHEALQTIQQTDASPLSTINKSFRGDIETIVAKALEKDKTRRYASAAELAADIRRYLHDEPIVARPPSTTYQIQKFAQRNKALVAGVAAVFVVLVLGIVASTWEAVQARRAEKKAEQESAIAQAVNDFLQKDMLGQASAYNQSKPDPNITVRAVLDRAAQNIQGKFAGQPEVEVTLRTTIGATYDSLGVYPEARRQLERALELGKQKLGANDLRVLTTKSALAGVAFYQGNAAEAEALDSQVLEVRRRVLGQNNPDTLSSIQSLSTDYLDGGKYAQAETLGREAVETGKRVLGPESPKTLRFISSLATVYEDEGKYAQAEALNLQALEISKRVLGPESPGTLTSIYNVASVYIEEGKYAQAEALDLQGLDIAKRVFGPEHFETLRFIGSLANIYGGEGKYAQAETLFAQALEISKRVFGPEHFETLRSMGSLADTYTAEGKYPQAETLFAQTLEIQERVLGPENPDAAQTKYDIGCLEALKGDKDKAIALVTDAVNHGLPPYAAAGIEKDMELNSLHNDPRFTALVAHAKQLAASKSAPAHTSK